jgi:hypothetical protein
MLDVILFALEDVSESYLKLSDFFSFQNTLTNTLLVVLVVLVTLLLAFGGYMFTKLDRVDQNVIDLKIAFAEIKAIMSMTKAVELGITQEAVLEQAKKEAEERIKKS